VLDLHSYNHRRQGPDSPADDPGASPDINFGTASVTAPRWRPLLDRMLACAREARLGHKRVSAGENVRFRGGYFPQWVNGRYGERGCAVAIEVKKLYMDEWTGRIYPPVLRDTTALMERLGHEASLALEEG
jgi:hypothetical protein